MQCLACCKHVQSTELLSCSACKGHYHYQCLNITAARFREKALELKRTWLCQDCQNVGRRKRNDQTPVRKQNESAPNISDQREHPTDESLIEHEFKEQEQSSRPAHSISNQGSKNMLAYDDFSKLLESQVQIIEASLTRTIKREINAAIDALKRDFTETTDFLAAEQKDLKADIRIANEQVKNLEKEKCKLSQELVSMTMRLQSLEKASRSCNVEVQNLPEGKLENVMNVFTNLTNQIGLKISEKDICSVRRVAKINPASDRPRNILATMSSERNRDQVIEAFKSYKKAHNGNPPNSTDLGMQGDKRNIYVVEHLPSEVKKLHAIVRKTANQLAYKYVWIKHGRIYVRKSDDSPCVHIKNENCLSELL